MSGMQLEEFSHVNVENIVSGYEERVLKEHFEAERMRSPAPTHESIRHRSVSPPKRKDKKAKKEKKKKKKRSASEEPRSNTPPLRTRSEEMDIDDDIAALGRHSRQPSNQFHIKIQDETESENEIPMRSGKLTIEDEMNFAAASTSKAKKDKKKKDKKEKKKKKKKGSSGDDVPGAVAKPTARPSRPPAIVSRRVVVVDPNSNQELTLEDALKYGLIDDETAFELTKQQGDYGQN